ncbi:flagellar basal body-associated protein FliL [Noviherbaspirillum sp. Root189]|uniref:flagellar basal body-associated protein FliL n=1 Tax=Noviherbaspirillum sp. Root189 TaxID=1736487 RepID=UPI00070BF012|nr:flagellar basal body-associated protein FliL [Noviherbaspirillum sp. Root189]KRB93325.1 flagellar basal body protein FliL [Noviherbaspirillum sp. Root189]
MATAPKASPKVVPIDEGAAAAAPAKKSKKKLFIIVGALLLVIGGAGGAWFFMGQGKDGHSETTEAAAPKVDPGKPPVFIAMEPFTINLQPENGEQYLQIAFTMQVADEKQVEIIKMYMPALRSRILLLLASKKASELSTIEGKTKLQEEILAQVKKPFTPQGPQQVASGVFFTSFVIQ